MGLHRCRGVMVQFAMVAPPGPRFTFTSFATRALLHSKRVHAAYVPKRFAEFGPKTISCRRSINSSFCLYKPGVGPS